MRRGIGRVQEEGSIPKYPKTNLYIARLHLLLQRTIAVPEFLKEKISVFLLVVNPGDENGTGGGIVWDKERIVTVSCTHAHQHFATNGDATRGLILFPNGLPEEKRTA